MKKLVASAAIAGMVMLGGTAAATAATAPKGASTEHPAAQAGARKRALARGALGVAADTIGVSRADLAKSLRDGKSVAQVAQAKSVDPQKVIDAVVAKARSRIQAAVTAGKLSTARAATMEQKLPQRVEKLVNHTFDGKSITRLKTARRAAVKIAADTIGIPAHDLVTQVRSGKTVAQVAQAKNVDPQKVIDAVVAKGTARIQAAVTAGKISPTRGAELTTKLTARVTTLVNATPHHTS